MHPQPDFHSLWRMQQETLERVARDPQVWAQREYARLHRQDQAVAQPVRRGQWFALRAGLRRLRPA